MRKYIAGIAQAAVTQEEQANNIRDSSKATSDAMASQLKTMSEQIAQLTKKLDNIENNGGGGGGGGGKDELRSSTTNHEAWAATISHTVSIQPARTTQALPVSGNSQTTTPQQRGTTGKVAACTGHHPSTSASSNRPTQPTRARQHRPTDRDRGRMITNEKKPGVKQ